MHWQQAAGWLVRACRAYRPETQQEDDEAEDGEMEYDVDRNLTARAVNPPGDCP